MQRVAIVNCSHCRSNVSMERNDSMQNHLRDCAPFLSGPVYEFKQGDVPLSRSDQWAQISELLQSNALVLNTPYFAVSSAWFESFLLYVQGFEGAEHPGCLDNSMLATVEADDRVVVRPNLDVDLFRFVHAQIWMRISAWYKGPTTLEIMRKVVRLNTGYVIEMYPIEVRVDFLGLQFLLHVSRHNRLRMVRHWAATAVSVTPHRCELLIVDLLPAGNGLIGIVREPREIDPEDMGLTLHEMHFGSSVLFLLNSLASFSYGNNARESRDRDRDHFRDVIRDRERMREFELDPMGGRDRRRDRPRARMRIEHELEEMAHFRMFAAVDENPRSPKRLLSSIARLPCCTFRSLQNVDEACLICMDAFGPETIVRQLLCKHVFCEGCILQWFGNSNCCPKCRADITLVLD